VRVAAHLPAPQQPINVSQRMVNLNCRIEQEQPVSRKVSCRENWLLKALETHLDHQYHTPALSAAAHAATHVEEKVPHIQNVTECYIQLEVSLLRC
jgi:hypothetical protein